MNCRFIELQPAADPAMAQQGWRVFGDDNGTTYDSLLDPMLVRAVSAGDAEAWIPTGPRTTNVAGGLHGGFLASIAEQTLVLPLFVEDRVRRSGVVTINFSVQYLVGGTTTVPILAQIELLRETGRMGFVRGSLIQQGEVIVAYAGTLRKLPQPE